MTSVCISRHGEFGDHALGADHADHLCTRCGALDEDGLRAELRDLRAFVIACSCNFSPTTYDGPEPDCPVHGAVRAYNEAAAERDALRAGIAALYDELAPRFAWVASTGLTIRLRILLDRTSMTGE